MSFKWLKDYVSKDQWLRKYESMFITTSRFSYFLTIGHYCCNFFEHVDQDPKLEIRVFEMM